MIKTYLRKNWSQVEWLHEEMFSRITFLIAQNICVNFFFVCNEVWQEEEKQLKLKKGRSTVSSYLDAHELDLESALASLKGVVKEVATLFSLGYSNTSVMRRLNINNYRLNLLKERLRNDRKFIDKIKSC